MTWTPLWQQDRGSMGDTMTGRGDKEGTRWEESLCPLATHNICSSLPAEQLSPSLLALDQCQRLWTCAVTRRMTKRSPFWSQVPHRPGSLFVDVQALISMQRLSESVVMPKLTNLPENHGFVKHSPGARKESEVLQDLWVCAPCFIKAPTLTIDQLCPRNVMAMSTRGRSKPTLSCLYSLAVHQYTHTKDVQIVWAESTGALPI